jgi:hypothetical protein
MMCSVIEILILEPLLVKVVGLKDGLLDRVKVDIPRLICYLNLGNSIF